jgi:peroxiredoxin
MTTVAPNPNGTLPERLAAFRANFEAGGPPWNAPDWIHAPMHRATDELIASGAAKGALKAGDLAPSFVLKDAEGREVSSAKLLSTGPLVLTFYRGFWCPYCNMDLQALQAVLPAVTERGAQLVAISPQEPVSSRRSQRDNHLTFPILSDAGNALAAQFGLRFSLPDYLADLYKNALKLDLEVVNNDPSWTLPMPARFVIAKNRTIAYAEVSPDYTNRPDPSELLPVLDRLRG